MPTTGYQASLKGRTAWTGGQYADAAARTRGLSRVQLILWESRMTKRVSPPVRRVEAGLERSLYDRIGGEKIECLVAAFYARVDRDPVIRRFYGKTLTCAIHALTDFMTTWLGGPPVYDLRGARLRRRHVPFAIDARARDAWLTNMKAAAWEVEIPDAEACLLLAHLEFGAGRSSTRANHTRTVPAPPEPIDSTRGWRNSGTGWRRPRSFSKRSRTATSPLIRTMLPMRLVPHAELMSHALARWLDPTGRADRRYGRRSKQVKPLEVVETLLAHRELDRDPAEEHDLGRFRQLQAMIEAYAGVSRMIEPDSPMHAGLRAATRDRFIAEVERDGSCARLLGLRGQTLLHDAAMAGDAELAAALIRSGAGPNAKEAEGHTPLYRASTGDVARVLLAAGATADVTSGPTRGTPLHQAARRGCVSVAQALLDHGATIDARDAKGETPLRRAVNCRQLEIVRLLVRRGADRRAADRRGVTPLDAARTAEIKRALDGDGA